MVQYASVDDVLGSCVGILPRPDEDSFFVIRYPEKLVAHTFVSIYFFVANDRDRFDCIVSNPPYVKYQNFCKV